MAADGEPVPGSLYIYAPNKVAPIIFTVAYAGSAFGHIWQCYVYKGWKMIGLHPFCGVMFTVGYAMREYGAYNYLYDEDNERILIIFILSQVFIYLCPPLLELANYHVLGHILFYVPHLAPLPPGKVLATFGSLMALVETLNAVGVSLSANPSSSKSQQDLGGHLTISALTLQLAIILIFIVLASTFHRRCAKAKIVAKPVTTPLITLYISMTLILIRCIYRLVEHVGNMAVDLDDMEKLRDLSPILRYEYYFYIFESTLMFVNSVLWNVWNPARLLPSNIRVHLAKDGCTVVEDEKRGGRTVLAKVGYALTFGAFFSAKN